MSKAVELSISQMRYLTYIALHLQCEVMVRIENSDRTNSNLCVGNKIYCGDTLGKKSFGGSSTSLYIEWNTRWLYIDYLCDCFDRITRTGPHESLALSFRALYS